MAPGTEPGQRYRQAIGETIRRLREKRAWSLGALSRHAHLSISYLSELENGRKEPSGGSLEQLATAFDLTLGEFLARVAQTLDASPGLPPEALRGLDQRALAELAQFAAWLRWRDQPNR